MARFSGKIGFGSQVEDKPGVWVDAITERSYFGDVIRNNRMQQEGEHLNNDIKVNVSISIVADAYVIEHFHAIRYVEWAGQLWKVPNVEVQAPRLILQVGEVYNGPPA